MTPTGPAQKPILWVREPQGLGPFPLRITESQQRIHWLTTAVAGWGLGAQDLGLPLPIPPAHASLPFLPHPCLVLSLCQCLSTCFSTLIPVCVSLHVSVTLCLCPSLSMSFSVSAYLSGSLRLSPSISSAREPSVSPKPEPIFPHLPASSTSRFPRKLARWMAAKVPSCVQAGHHLQVSRERGGWGGTCGSCPLGETSPPRTHAVALAVRLVE